ncbi:MAG: UbiA family prenyltransferase [Methanomicrobiales archaeon]|nr:UbiA family prenyltransferase [Methanomicrobiales archaeon]
MSFSTHGVVHGVFDPFWIIRISSQRSKEIVNFMVFSSVFVGLICTAMTYISCFIQNLPCSFSILAIPFLVTFSVYNLNKRSDEIEDSINRQDRYSFTKRYERPLFIGALAAYAAACMLAAFSGAPALLITAFPFLTGILYSMRLLPGRFHYSRLKDIPVMKNIAVSCSWIFFAGLLPVFMNDAAPNFRTLIALLSFFSWAFCASILPDMRDREGDARTGIHTIPVILGDEKTRDILYRVNLTCGIIIVLLGFNHLPFILLGTLMACTAYTHGCIYLYGKIGSRDLVSDFLSDGQYIFFTIAILILTSAHIFL